MTTTLIEKILIEEGSLEATAFKCVVSGGSIGGRVTTVPGCFLIDPEGLVPEGETVSEFCARMRPIFEDGAVTGWEEIPTVSFVSISENPNDDMSNSPEIVLQGPAGVGFEVVPSRPISISLPSAKGSFGEEGEVKFKVKVLGSGPLWLKVKPQQVGAFRPLDIEVTVDSGFEEEGS